MLQGVGHILRKCIEDGERICAVTACRGMLVTELKLPISCRDSQGYLVVTQSELREVKPKVGYEVKVVGWQRAWIRRLVSLVSNIHV
jgi:hypothetical protein